MGQPHMAGILQQHKHSTWMQRVLFGRRSCLTLFHMYKNMTKCNVGDDKSITLWKDRWNGSIREETYPYLHSFLMNESTSM
jgi:hypothetical protein